MMSFSVLLVGILVMAVVFYGSRTILFMVGAMRERAYAVPEHTDDHPMISVIVPARNEESVIERCIRSIMSVHYPREAFELIIVNDQSDDATVSIVEALQQEFPTIRLLHTEHLPMPSLSLRGKPRALHIGIMQAQGELLMMTDADCTVEPEWLTTAAKVFADPHIGMMPSFTVINQPDIFARLQGLMWVFNHTMASAGIGLRQPLGCFGNNITLRAQVYQEIGGYPAIPFSVTEDLALLQTVAQTSWEIRYVCDHRLKVTTNPCMTLGEFLKQQHRWATGGKALGWRATIFVLSSTALWLGIAMSLFCGEWVLAVGLVAFRWLCDTMVYYPSLIELRMTYLQRWSYIATPLFLLLELISPLFLLRSGVTWKGRTHG
jgi:1,2-diacylglycerol 3-beta-glucosyltransferase